MTKLISAASYAASKSLESLAQNGLDIQPIRRSQIQEVLAAMLGYQTYAALTVEEQDDSLDFHLDDAEMLVLNQPVAERRAIGLGIGLDAIPQLIKACVSAIQGATSMRVHEGMDDFYDSYAREALVEAIIQSDDVSATMSETNAEFDSEPYLPIETPATEDLWEARTEWSVEASGDMKGGHDIDSDRMFVGDTLNCRGKLTFAKAGRAGLILLDSEASAGVDESWRELDAEDYESEADEVDLSDFGGTEAVI